MLLYPLPGRTRIALTGRDRQSFLHGFCTNEIKKLTPGQGCEAFVTTIKARVLGHIFIAADDNGLFLDTVAGQATPLITHLDRYVITEDVQFNDLTEQTATYFASIPAGPPSSESIISTILQLAPYCHTKLSISSTSVFAQRLDWFGVPGYLISLPKVEAEMVLEELSSQGVTLASAESFEQARVTAGFPLFGQDITDANLPQEVDRTEVAISFKKGCYLGQEPIARLDALGHVNKILRRFEISQCQKPMNVPSDILAVDSEQKIGTLTSATTSQSSARGMGYINVKYAAGGQIARVAADKGHQAMLKVIDT